MNTVTTFVAIFPKTVCTKFPTFSTGNDSELFPSGHFRFDTAPEKMRIFLKSEFYVFFLKNMFYFFSQKHVRIGKRLRNEMRKTTSGGSKIAVSGESNCILVVSK